MRIEAPETPGIISRPDVLFGKPVFEGTRISVELIMERIASGQTVDDILADHSHLTQNQVLAALTHSTQLVRAEAMCAIQRATGARVAE